MIYGLDGFHNLGIECGFLLLNFESILTPGSFINRTYNSLLIQWSPSYAATLGECQIMIVF